MTGATDHLPRLLALVPWLLAHPGTPVSDVAREFGVSEEQLRADLNLLWMCGLPGYGPGDLIDVTWKGDRVTLSNADEIARPLRLTAEEGLALVAALRIVSEEPGIVERTAIDRALAKLEAAAGAAAGTATERVVSAPSSDSDARVVATATGALARGKRLKMLYWVPARDEATDREVDPLRLFTTDGRAYLAGWCYLVDDLRTFRLDRVLEISVLDTAVDVTDETRRRALGAGLLTPAADDRLVTFSLDPSVRWFADYYPCEAVTERGDGGLIVRLRVTDDAWVRRLALGLAGRGRVIDPPELADEVRDVAIATLSAYRR
ncbi:MAG TPA: WYL domain-containing protein [Mycobacteriales bacterium]|nr:WYL domain-containing protein [Mycobacteriales bacterium]